jgi:hypothetical protein
VPFSERCLNILRNDESAGFLQVTIGDESWFSCRYQSTYYYSTSRVVRPSEQKRQLLRKGLWPSYFSPERNFESSTSFVAKKCNQNCFLVILIPELARGNRNTGLRVGNNLLLVSMDRSICDTHEKVRSICTEKQRGESVILFILPNARPMMSGSSRTQKSKRKIKSSRTRTTCKQVDRAGDDTRWRISHQST